MGHVYSFTTSAFICSFGDRFNFLPHLGHLLYSYFFPDEKELFRKKAEEAVESRFQAGIHFHTDNEVALELGKKVGNKVIQKVKNNGADPVLSMVREKRNGPKTKK